MLYLLVTISVFLTSLLSGVVGMAGGIILLAILVSLMNVPNAMFMHGLVQAFANGSRFLMIRQHVVWSTVPAYFLGTSTALLPFVLLTIVPNKGMLLLLIGTITLLGVNIPKSWGLDIKKPWVSFLCGATVGFTQLLAGTSGPILDLFFQKSQLNRFEIVATKAFTQTIGHVCKMAYYLYITVQLTWLSTSQEILGLTAVAVVVSTLGTWCGVQILRRIREQTFQNLLPWIIRLVSIYCVLQGSWELFGPTI